MKYPDSQEHGISLFHHFFFELLPAVSDTIMIIDCLKYGCNYLILIVAAALPALKSTRVVPAARTPFPQPNPYKP